MDATTENKKKVRHFRVFARLREIVWRVDYDFLGFMVLFHHLDCIAATQLVRLAEDVIHLHSA